LRFLLDLCFFFSSRRRHTRFDCDWSSDVCSSDLKKQEKGDDDLASARAAKVPNVSKAKKPLAVLFLGGTGFIGPHMVAHSIARRSEERRVGKECRSRWSPYH